MTANSVVQRMQRLAKKKQNVELIVYIGHAKELGLL